MLMVMFYFSGVRVLIPKYYIEMYGPGTIRHLLQPKSGSSQSTFLFECNEDGALKFEYKIFDFTERLDITPWLAALKDQVVEVSWLDSKKGGPGSGFYTLYLRAGEINDDLYKW